MGLRKIWRRVRSLSERPHNILAVSDIHLGSDLKPGLKYDCPRTSDPALVSFLDWHGTHRPSGKPWRLILNGDIVDFIAITLVPQQGPFSISVEERELGLAPSEPKCVWKLRRTAERHPAVFDALAKFIHKGNSIHIIRGNHDAEWRWPGVQAEFRQILLERSGLTSAAARRRFERAIEFHDWFYLEPGFFYAEHGHAHDVYSVQSDFFAEHGGALAQQEMGLSLSSKVLRYFVNRYAEQVELTDDVDAWGLKEYLDWVLKAGNPLRVAADYFVMVFRVIYPLLRKTLSISRAFARVADKAIASKVEPHAHVRRMLARFQGTDKQARQLVSIAAKPGEQSLFDSMQLFYLDRMLLALLCLACALSTASAVHGFWLRAGALTGVGILFAALNALLAGKRKTDAHPMLQQAARRVSQVFDVKYIVMGHSHRAVDEPLGNGARYFNLGSWTGRPGDGFPHVVVQDSSAELRRWKGPPVLELPLRMPEPPPEFGVPVLA
jgi:UDP-2,3-diacylglucosamine pyrophosphatase LpxH